MAEEYIMTRILKMTHTDYKNINFESVEYCQNVLKRAGFSKVWSVELKSILPYPHTLLAAEK